MALAEWEVRRYESAATEMCHRMHEDPYKQVSLPEGWTGSLWVLYATRMAEQQIMVEAMRAFGHAI